MNNHESSSSQESAPPPKNNSGTDEAKAIEIKLKTILELEELRQLEEAVRDKKAETKKSDKKYEEIEKKKTNIFSNVTELLGYVNRDVKVTDNPGQQAILKGISDENLSGSLRHLINSFLSSV